MAEQSEPGAKWWGEDVVWCSRDGEDNPQRRQEAQFVLSVMAWITEPGWLVEVDGFEQRVSLVISERSHGDDAVGDQDMLEMYFHHPDTLFMLAEALRAAGTELAEVLADSAVDPKAPDRKKVIKDVT